MKTLQIVIAGKAGAGKTTVGRAVFDFLKANGFNVSFKDDDQKTLKLSQKECEEAVKKKTEIQISTARVSRELI